MGSELRCARDPGVRLSQLGSVTWIHCPECDGPAKLGAVGVSCIRCNYRTQTKVKPLSDKWAKMHLSDPRCTHCRHPLANPAVPTARHDGKRLLVRVQCPHCRQTVDYPGKWAFPPTPQTMHSSRYLPLFLTAKVGGHTLWVDNMAHLDALDAYLRATLRERGPVRGLTMMARLPAWMKSGINRPKVVRGLRQLRDRAKAFGIDE